MTSEALAVSVVVVSQGDPEALARCLTSLIQLTYPNFELIVIADGAGLHRVDQMPSLFQRIKRMRFDAANLAHARNFGLAQAAGEVVAFIDGSAVAEPRWLDHLAAPFEDDRVMSTGGTVLGDDGFTVLFGPESVDSRAVPEPLEFEDDTPILFATEPGVAIRTQATNMAFRRSVLSARGGFDPVFPQTLAATDANLRLAEDRHVAALVPLAQVHVPIGTGSRASVTRDLTEQGAALAAFLRKHAEPSDHADAIALARTGHRNRLLRQMIRGDVEPGDIAPILASFERGLAEGAERPKSELNPLPAPSVPFHRFESERPEGAMAKVLPGFVWRREQLQAEASTRALSGLTSTIMLFSLDWRRHSQQFRMPGVWVQSGGIWGASRPDVFLLKPWQFRERVAHEVMLFEAVRGKAARTD